MADRTPPVKGTAKNAKPETSAFVYVHGDAAKAPVDPETQPKGTQLVLVTPGGTEYAAVAGVTQFNLGENPEVAAALARAKQWDAADRKFPNLVISREG